MNESNSIDINTFCYLPTHISTILDGDGTEWFTLDNQLRELLELHRGFAHELLPPWIVPVLCFKKRGWHE